MILLILEPHRALHFGARVDKRPQRIARQRMVVAAGVHVFELTRLVVAALGILAVEKKSFNLVCRIQRVAFPFVQLVRISLERSANVRAIRRTVLVDHLAKHENLARAEHIRRRPVKRAPIHRQPQIAFPLRRESANRRAIKREVVPALDQEFLVVVQHVQAAFQIAEQHCHGLDPLLVGKVLQSLFLNFVRRDAIFPLLLSLYVQLFQLCIR